MYVVGINIRSTTLIEHMVSVCINNNVYLISTFLLASAILRRCTNNMQYNNITNNMYA